MAHEMKIQKFLTSLITARFLSLIEKWARYQGKDFYIGDVDVYIRNMGIFTVKTETPKITITKGNINVSKNKTETYVETYDVTEIKNTCVCSDFNTRILVAQRYDKSFMDEDWKKENPAKLYVFSVFEDKLIDDTQYPSFERLKKDFESGIHKAYNSLLYEFCEIYQLMPFNNHTDRIYNFTGIEGDLEYIEACTDQWTEEAKLLPTPQRPPNK